ncbi:MAG: twin-arginine translocase TatA/TatE family subunit [Bacteroidales bacterium]|jgi:sec-independent protein translocase protein TatA|nr:twin-arginine translocase TatA/TatE family subunit [Bacteroidales bacterium]
MNLYILLGMVGPWQVVIIIVAILLLFGGKKIPELMKGLGQGMKEFKKATSDMKAEMDSEIKDVKEVIDQDKEEK